MYQKSVVKPSDPTGCIIRFNQEKFHQLLSFKFKKHLQKRDLPKVFLQAPSILHSDCLARYASLEKPPGIYLYYYDYFYDKASGSGQFRIRDIFQGFSLDEILDIMTETLIHEIGHWLRDTAPQIILWFRFWFLFNREERRIENFCATVKNLAFGHKIKECFYLDPV